MVTLEVRIPAPSELHDVLVAELDALGFDAFTASRSDLCAYTRQADTENEIKASLAQLMGRYGIVGVPEVTAIPDRNWNREWEARVSPVRAGTFLVAPSWADVPRADSTIVLRIDPKMSFGTGHHESTRLALRLLEDFVRLGDRVLDAGTGTGILAIAAIKLGAAKATAFDIDRWTADNCPENIRRNGVEQLVAFVHGDISAVSESDFDVVVANINRSVLLDLIPGLVSRARPGGLVVLSGLLRTDADAISARALSIGLSLVRTDTEGEWWGSCWKRNSEGLSG